jgi:T4 RnlA family RNA ligase
MTNFTQETYKDLMTLVVKNDSFYFKDFTLEDKIYRVFNYHLASWSLFLEPGALNCRGIMFDVTNENDIKLVSLPPEKFFNYEEGGVDHTKCSLGDKMVKMDGSLISTYLHNGELYLKSKGSLFSEQANDAMKMLAGLPEFKEELKQLALMGYTVNLEYTSPKNRIVVSYADEQLTILSARSHLDGKNLFATSLKNMLERLGDFDCMVDRMVDFEDLRQERIEQLKFMDEIRQETFGEGYVIEFIREDQSSYLAKAKNLRYVALHHTKDSVNSAKRLFEVVIGEGTDDLRAMFADDQYVLDQIDEMEKRVQPIFNRLIKTVENFYEQNKNLERKDYAMKAQKEKPHIMSLLMNMYLTEKIASGEIVPRPATNGKPYQRVDNDYKAFSLKFAKELYGIGDDDAVLNADGEMVKNNKVISSVN